MACGGARRAQDRIARGHRHLVGGGEHRIDVLTPHPSGQFGGGHVAAEPQVHDGARLGLEHDPCLGLAVRTGQVLSREAAVGMDVQRQSLAGVEQLDQQPGLRTVTRDVLAAKPPDRIVADHGREERAVGEPGHASGSMPGPGRGGRDPVLGPVRAGIGVLAEPGDPARAAVERVRHVGRQDDWSHPGYR